MKINLKMDSTQVFQLLRILDKIQLEAKFFFDPSIALDRIKAIFSEVREFESKNGIETPKPMEIAK